MARQIQRIIQGAELKEFAEFYRFRIRYHEEIYTGFRCQIVVMEGWSTASVDSQIMLDTETPEGSFSSWC